MTKGRKTNAGRWSRSGSTRDLPTIAFFRAGALLRRNGPVPGILASHRPGAIMDKSGHRFVVRHGRHRSPEKGTHTQKLILQSLNKKNISFQRPARFLQNVTHTTERELQPK
jgi:hypothetical protein